VIPGNVPTPAIQLRDLRFAWNGRDTIDIPQMSVGRGERLFLQGPSGSGKSTLLGLIGGVLTPSAGDVLILDQSLSLLSGARRDRFRADHIGFIFQQFNLLPFLDVIENVLLPCRFSRRRAERARVEAGSEKAQARMLLEALDLDAEVLAKPVRELSVGQQQRVAAARALIGSPEILIVDEPTSALDEDARASFLGLLIAQCHRERSTLVFVSHDSGLATFFERKLLLREVNRVVTTAVN